MTQQAKARARRWVRRSRTRGGMGARRALYLSAEEARALAVLSGTSPFALGGGGGDVRRPGAATGTARRADESALFDRIGRFLRTF